VGRMDDLLAVEAAGQLPPEMQQDLELLRASGEAPAPLNAPATSSDTPAPDDSLVGTFNRRVVQPAIDSVTQLSKLGTPEGLDEVITNEKAKTALAALHVGGTVAAPGLSLALGTAGSVAEYGARKAGASPGLASGIGTATELAPVGVAAVKGIKAGVNWLSSLGTVAEDAPVVAEEASGPVAKAVTAVAEAGAKPELTMVDAAMEEGVKAGATTTREAMQYGLFDDAGRVRPTVAEYSGPTVEGATAHASAELVDAVKAEGVQSAELLASTSAAKDDQRLYHQVAELFETGAIDAPGLTQELADRGLSMPQFVEDYFKPSVRRGARQLQQLSTLRQHLTTLAATDPEAAKAVNALASRGVANRFWDILQKVDDTRRALLISQVKTGVRNAVSQGVAAGTDLLEAGMTGGTTAMRDQLEAVGRAFNNDKSRAVIMQALKYRSDLAAKLGEFEYRPPSYIDDVPILKATLGKFTELTTWVNRYQEDFFRRSVFDATLRQGLRAQGIDVAKALDKPKLIPDALLEHATSRALELTFAQDAPGGLRKVVEGFQLARPIATFVVPFPRYMANAAVYVAKRNPLGLVRLMTAAGRAEAPKVMSEAAVGSMLIGGALSLRYSSYGGEKWYQVKSGDKEYDLRGFAGPFAPYLFAADAIKQVLDTGHVNYKGGDVVEGILSMNRLAGTASTILSWLQGKADDPESWAKGAEKLIGDWIGGFSTPAKNVKDAFAAIGNEEEGKMRDTRGYPLTGATRSNLPVVSTQLPESVDLTTGQSRKNETPILGGVLGLYGHTVHPIEAEMNRLNIAVGDVAPKTGIPKADRELYRRVGKIIAITSPKVIATTAYQRLTPAEQTMAIKGLFRNAREIAKENLKATKPGLAAAVHVSDVLTGDKRALLREQGVDVQSVLQKLIDREPESTDTSSAPPAAAAPAPQAPRAAENTDANLRTAVVVKGKITPQAVEDVASITGVPLPVLQAAVHQESGGQVHIESSQGAKGVMQMLPATFDIWKPQVEAITGRSADVNNPVDNLIGGALMYKKLLEEHGGDVEAAARYYHGGPNVRIHGEKTRAYGTAVADAARRYAGE
jgi:soluble lytic murein transglycosylase-like protein